jgi:hypothetical protein
MSTRQSYDNQQRATELHDEAAHAHSVAEQQGKQDHLTGHEQTRQAREHSQEAPEHTREATVGHGITAFGHEDIAALAFEKWQTRGCPDGSPEEDWFAAVEELRSRNFGR